MLRIPIIMSSDERDKNKYSSHDFTIPLENSFNFLQGTYYLSVSQLNTWYSHPNISADLGNNIFTYTNGITTYNLTFPDGVYNLSSIATRIQDFLIENGDFTDPHGAGIKKHYTFPINFTPNLNTGKIDWSINSPYTVDFTTSLIYQIFGTVSSVKSADFEGEEPGNINNYINQININCDLCQGSGILGGANSSVIYSYVPDTLPYGPINIRPALRSYVQITASKPTSYRVWLTDNLGRPINLRNEPFAINCDIVQMS